jgi:hypothetical protein
MLLIALLELFLANRLRGWLEDLERLLNNSGQTKRQRLPVPVPVRAPRDPKYYR